MPICYSSKSKDTTPPNYPGGWSQEVLVSRLGDSVTFNDANELIKRSDCPLHSIGEGDS